MPALIITTYVWSVIVAPINFTLLFKAGNPGGGRPKDTPETILIKKAVKEIIKEYKEDLADMLPEIKPILKKKKAVIISNTHNPSNIK